MKKSIFSVGLVLAISLASASPPTYIALNEKNDIAGTTTDQILQEESYGIGMIGRFDYLVIVSAIADPGFLSVSLKTNGLAGASPGVTNLVTSAIVRDSKSKGSNGYSYFSMKGKLQHGRPKVDLMPLAHQRHHTGHRAVRNC